jgi:gas vesicle structural protein
MKPERLRDDGEVARHVGLIELVNRVLDKGAVVTGEVVIGVGGVDLIYVGLQLVLSSIESMERRQNRPDPTGADG